MVEPGFGVPEDELLSRTYLLLKRSLPPAADWREYALTTVPGTFEVVVLDFPGRLGVFGRQQVTRYGHDRLRRAGLANLSCERPAARVVEGVHVLRGSAYTASTALVLAAMVARVSGETRFPHGVLVSVPERTVMTYHVPADGSLPSALRAMTGITRGVFADARAPISEDVYWWDGSAFHRITGLAEDGTVNDRPDGGFAAVLDRVREIPVGRG